jgi:alpha-tubulin suppressor-like RCC1 family protein
MLKFYSLALSANSVTNSANTSLYVWGNNSSGQLGDGTTVDKSTPIAISNFIGNSFASLVNGSKHSIALDATGALYAWGDNTLGQLGDGTTVGKSTAVKIGSSSWSAIGTANNTSIAVTTTGLLYAWGDNTFYAVGDGTSVNRSSPVQISGIQIGVGAASWKMLSVGNNHSAGIRADNTLWTWGLNGGGQLGDGSYTNKSSPVQIGTSAWNYVSAGESQTMAIRSDGALFSWGGNISGQLGDPSLATGGFNRNSPVQIAADKSWTIVSTSRMANAYLTMGITTTGALWTWGQNNNGSLGDGTTVSKSSPVQIGTSSWSFVSAGYVATAITTSGALFTWGYNNTGGIGDGTTVNKSSPVQIGTSSWSFVSSGGASLTTMGITTSGALFAWGFGGSGILGDGTTVGKSSPVQIGSSSWTKVSVGYGSVLAITTTGALFGWGQNGSGQIGDNTTVGKSSPVQVGSSSWSYVASAGGNNGMYPFVGGINSSSNLYMWGSNGFSLNTGFLGDNTTTNKSTPVVINTTGAPGATDTSFAAVLSSGLGNIAYAVSTTGFLYGWGDRSTNAVPSDLTTRTPIGFLFGSNSTNPPGFGIQTSWKSVARGESHVAAITSTGDLYCWGQNGSGQIGSNDVGVTANKFSPTKIGSSSWSVVSAGGSHTMGITITGALFAWGNNGFGNLGDNTTVNKSSPVQIGSSSWSAVSAGRYYTLGITTSGNLYAWGSNNSGPGELGDGTTLNKSSPVQIGSNTNWSKVFARTTESFAITTTGTLFAWGNASVGQLGDGTTVNKSSPVQIGSSSWTMVTSGMGTGIAGITTTGALFTWGIGSDGQLGDGTTVNRSSPVQIGSSSWSFVASDGRTVAAVTTTGYLFLWGSNGVSQLGDGATVSGASRSSPVQLGINNTWSSVQVNGTPSAGQAHVSAILKNGMLLTWGASLFAQLGTGESPVLTSARSTPIALGVYSSTFSTSNVSAIRTTASGTAVFLDKAGSVYTNGNNTYGELGQGVTTGVLGRSLVGGITNISTGNSHVVAVQGNSLFVWGNGTSNQLTNSATNGSVSGNIITPTNIPIGNKNYDTSSWKVISAGYGNTAAIRTDGTLWVWGQNQYGAVGDGTTTYARLIPTQVGFSSWSAVSAGALHIIGIKIDGTLWGWGYNTTGQLGDGTTVNKSSPVQIGLNTNWSKVSAGDSHSAAINSSGTLFTWGQNVGGELGDNTTVNKSSPVQIGSSSWTMVSSFNSTSSGTIGITTSGALFAWGYNNRGQLGDGTTVNKSSPVQIGSSSWTMVSAGNQYAMGITTTGALFGWGGNSSTFAGSIGDNTSVDKSSPVQIGSSSWSFVTAGVVATFGITTSGALYGWGYNNYYTVGDGTSVTRVSPVLVSTPGISWSTLSCGYHAVALTTTGALYTWGGLNSFGQLGINNLVNNNGGPTRVNPTFSIFPNNVYKSISASGNYTSLLTYDTANNTNVLYSWGDNSSGQYGNGTFTSYTVMSPVSTYKYMNTLYGSSNFVLMR